MSRDTGNSVMKPHPPRESPDLIPVPDSSERVMWTAAVIGIVCGMAVALLVAPQYTSESRHYLLSSTAQALAAILALAVSLPLVFAGLSGYVAGEVPHLVRDRHFVGFVTLYATSIMHSLVLLRFECTSDVWVDAALALALACLLTLIFYVRWTASRLDPRRYLARAFRRAHSNSADVLTRQQALGETVAVARLAIQNGIDRYWEDVLENTLRLWVQAAAEQNYSLSGQVRSTFEHVLSALVRDELAAEKAGEEIRTFLVMRFATAPVPKGFMTQLSQSFATVLLPTRANYVMTHAIMTEVYTLAVVLTHAGTTDYLAPADLVKQYIRAQQHLGPQQKHTLVGKLDQIANTAIVQMLGTSYATDSSKVHAALDLPAT